MRFHEILTERRQQRVRTMYHGTSSIFLKSILKNGLLANPPKRVYTDGEFATIGGAYITPSKVAALRAAKTASHEFGGKEIIIEMDYVEDSGDLDEDSIHTIIEKIFLNIHENIDDILDDEDFVETSYDMFLKLGKDKFKDSYKTRDIFLPYIETIRSFIYDNVSARKFFLYTNLENLRKYKKYDYYLDELMKTLRPVGTENVRLRRDIKFKGKTKIVKIYSMEFGRITEVFYDHGEVHKSDTYFVYYMDLGDGKLILGRASKYPDITSFRSALSSKNKIDNLPYDIDDIEIQTAKVYDTVLKDELQPIIYGPTDRFKVVNGIVKYNK